MAEYKKPYQILFDKLKNEVGSSISAKAIKLILEPYKKIYDDIDLNLFIEKEGLDIVGKKIINLRSNMFLQKLYFYIRHKNMNYAINQSQLLGFMKNHFKVEISEELLLKMHGILIYEMGDLCKFVNDKYQMLSLDEIRIAFINNEINKEKFKLYKKITKIERKRND